MKDQFARLKRSLPKLGIGLGLRSEIAQATFENTDVIDWLEITPENYMRSGPAPMEMLERATSLFPLISHGVSLSLGSTDPLNPEYLKKVKFLLDRVNAPWWSDHICFSSIDGVYTHDLLPMPRSRAAVRHLCERIRRAQDYMERPLLVENISFYMPMPGAEMDEAQFLSEVLERADCGLLLDVNNVYVNSVNHKFDPMEFVKQLPLDRVVQIHVAGHDDYDSQLIDTHGMPVCEPVYELLAYVLSKADVNGVMIERDQNFPEFGELKKELQRLKEMYQNSQGQRPTSDTGPNHTSALAINSATSTTSEGTGSRSDKHQDQHDKVLYDIEKGFYLLTGNEVLRTPWLKGKISNKKSDKPLRPFSPAKHGKGIGVYAWLTDASRLSATRSMFPVTSKVLEQCWTELISDYFYRCPPKHFNYCEIADKFPAYLRAHGSRFESHHRLIAEVAAVERLKLILLVDRNTVDVTPFEPFTREDQISSQCPQLNPLLHLASFPSNILDLNNELWQGLKLSDAAAKEQGDLSVFAFYRTSGPANCEIVKLTDLQLQAIQLIQENSWSYSELMEHMLKVSKSDSAGDAANLLRLFEGLHELQIFVAAKTKGQIEKPEQSAKPHRAEDDREIRPNGRCQPGELIDLFAAIVSPS